MKKKVTHNLKTSKSMIHKTLTRKSMTRKSTTRKSTTRKSTRSKLNTINRNKSKRKGGANRTETIDLDSLRLSNDDEIEIKLRTETGDLEMVVENPDDNVLEEISKETGMKDIKVMFGDYELTNNEDTFRGIGIEDGATLMVLKKKNLTVFVRSNCFSNSERRAYDVDDSHEIEQTLRDEMDIPNNVPVDILIDGEMVDDHSTFADYIEHMDSIEMNSINREMNIKVTTDGYVECYHEE